MIFLDFVSFRRWFHVPLHVVVQQKDFTTKLFDSSVSSQRFTSLIMESARSNVTSLDLSRSKFLSFISFLLLVFFLLLSPLLFDKSLFSLSDFLSLLGVVVLSRNDVLSFPVHDCSCKFMVKKGGYKSEAFSLAKTENLFEVATSFVLLLIFSCETFLGNMNSCFSDCFGE